LVIGSALLTILAFPDFDLWFLAWVSLVPLLIVVARTASAKKAFFAGWVWGTIFFYGTCWWLTYPMIHYAEFRAPLAYALLLLPIIFVALFPALACAVLCHLIRQVRPIAILLAPFLWVSCEWLRYEVTGQVWNALGYSQAFHPSMIQSARWGGVYLVGFAILLVNTAVAFLLIRRQILVPVLCVVLSAMLLAMPSLSRFSTDRRIPYPEIQRPPNPAPALALIAVQPNVPIALNGDDGEMTSLLDRHLRLTSPAAQTLKTSPSLDNSPKLVVWPESPMNFSYSRDPHLRQVIGDFTSANNISLLLNSLEPAKGGGDQNSAILVNEKGEMSARYDKIRLMPFGEYVPLPRWLPGASSVRGIVGEFTPGNSYTLMPLGALRVGVFICIEAAHPAIARSFTNAGADVLINITNDGYLGQTPVMRQHLANAVFRAVENDRDLVRVTNTGITAFISSTGDIFDQTTGFHEDVRTWTINRSGGELTLYSRYGDAFVYGCVLISLGFISASFIKRRVSAART